MSIFVRLAFAFTLLVLMSVLVVSSAFSAGVEKAVAEPDCKSYMKINGVKKCFPVSTLPDSPRVETRAVAVPEGEFKITPVDRYSTPPEFAVDTAPPEDGASQKD